MKLSNHTATYKHSDSFSIFFLSDGTDGSAAIFLSDETKPVSYISLFYMKYNNKYYDNYLPCVSLANVAPISQFLNLNQE